MKYRVVLTSTAKAEIDDAYAWLRSRTDVHAARWFNGLSRAIASLDADPHRGPRIPEVRGSDLDLRQIIHGERAGRYRVIYWVGGDHVYVLHVRHGARRGLDEAALAAIRRTIERG